MSYARFAVGVLITLPLSPLRAASAGATRGESGGKPDRLGLVVHVGSGDCDCGEAVVFELTLLLPLARTEPSRPSMERHDPDPPCDGEPGPAALPPYNLRRDEVDVVREWAGDERERCSCPVAVEDSVLALLSSFSVVATFPARSAAAKGSNGLLGLVPCPCGERASGATADVGLDGGLNPTCPWGVTTC